MSALDGDDMAAVEQKLENARQVLREIDRHLWYLTAARTLLERSTFDSMITDSFNNTFEAHGFNLIVQSLTNELMAGISRLFDPKRPDRASFAMLEHILSDNQVVEAVCRAARGWPGVSDSNEDRARALIHEALHKLGGMDKLALNRVRQYRHRYLSHSLIEERIKTHQPPKFEDAFQLHDLGCFVFEKLNVAITGQHIICSEVNRVWERYADQFWCTCRKGLEASKQ